MRSKELPKELRDRIVARHRSGHGYKIISATLKVPKSTVASIILTWKKFGTTRTLPRPGRPAKLSSRGRRALVREVKKNPKITVAELQRCSREMGESSTKSTITAALHQSGLCQFVNLLIIKKTEYLETTVIMCHVNCLMSHMTAVPQKAE